MQSSQDLREPDAKPRPIHLSQRPGQTPTAFATRLVAARKHASLAELAGLHISNIRRYEAGTNQPTIDALRNLALALNASTDKLLFEPHEREPDDDLKHAFQAASTRLDPESRAHLQATLEGLLLRNEARRWAS